MSAQTQPSSSNGGEWGWRWWHQGRSREIQRGGKPTQAKGNANATNGAGHGRGRGAGQGEQSNPKPEQPQVAALQQPEAEGEPTNPGGESGKGGLKDGSKDGSAGKDGSTGETALISEVTSLLRSLRAPQLRAAYVRKMDTSHDGSYLLDGGATNCLRKAKSNEEWETGTPQEVNLAMGSVVLRQLPSGTLITQDPTQPIIPLNDLTKIGVVVHWSEGMCNMTQHGRRLRIYGSRVPLCRQRRRTASHGRG